MHGVTQQELSISRRSAQRAAAQREVDEMLEAGRMEFAERAAILEFDAHLSREVAEVRAREQMTKPLIPQNAQVLLCLREGR